MSLNNEERALIVRKELERAHETFEEMPFLFTMDYRQRGTNVHMLCSVSIIKDEQTSKRIWPILQQSPVAT